MAAFEIKDLTSETWTDFETLFGKHRGVRGGCWCTFYRCTAAEFERMTRDERKALQQRLVQLGSGHGVLVYDEGIPVAWCQFGPAGALPQFDRGRDYGKLVIEAEEAPQWRISCLFADKHRRREGLSNFALKAALGRIRERGGGIVEAFPFDLPGNQHPQHTGSVAMYAREGFEKVARLGKNAILMRRNIRPNE